MKTTRFLAVLLICVLVAVSLAGCYNPATVLTVGEREISCGQYLYHQYYAIGAAMADAEVTELSDLWSKQFDGVDAFDYVHAETLMSILKTEVVRNECERLGLTLDSSAQSSAEYYANYYYSQAIQNNGISYESFLTAVQDQYLSEPLFDAYYAEGGEFEVSDEDLRAHYAEAYVKVKYISMPTADGAGLSLDATKLALVEDAAREIVERMNAGESLKDVLLDVYAALQKELGYADSAIITADNYDEKINESAATDGELTEDMMTAIRACEMGEYCFTRNESAAFVVQRVELYESDEDWEKLKETALVSLMREPFEEYLEELAAELEYTADERAIKYYSPKKAVF